jgi:hypothetical protein
MALSLDGAAEVFREATREAVKRYSLWYLIQGILLLGTRILAIIYPVLSSAAVIVPLGSLLIISGIVQGLSLIGARHVPHFWLQLISVNLAVLIDRLLVPARSGSGHGDDCAASHRLFHDGRHLKVGFALTIGPFPNWAGCWGTAKVTQTRLVKRWGVASVLVRPQPAGKPERRPDDEMQSPHRRCRSIAPPPSFGAGGRNIGNHHELPRRHSQSLEVPHERDWSRRLR